jgi:hypothetical protein
MEDSGKIIVYKTFDSAIDANIAKTKLDAHGIPCFLTEENMAALYPLSFFPAIQIRLHLFEQDVALANTLIGNL